MKRTPLRRKTRLRPKRKTPRRSARQRDTEYMLRVKQLPCCAPHELLRWLNCTGVTEAHHAGKRAAGRKADDDTCIPLSVSCHAWWHAHAGPFCGWTRDERRSWADARIAETQAKLSHPHAQVEPTCPF